MLERCPDSLTVAAGCTIKDFREFCQTNPINIRQMGCGESMTKFKVTKVQSLRHMSEISINFPLLFLM